MKITHRQAYTWVAGVSLFALVGLSACDTGTRPGETNVERSEIRDEGELVGNEGDGINQAGDTANLEKYYDHADHDDHKDNDAEAIGDGAYDGKKNGPERDDFKKN